MDLENCALLWKISSYAPVLLDMFFYSVEKYVKLKLKLNVTHCRKYK